MSASPSQAFSAPTWQNQITQQGPLPSSSPARQRGKARDWILWVAIFFFGCFSLSGCLQQDTIVSPGVSTSTPAQSGSVWPIYGLAWSSNGAWIAYGGADDQIYICDAINCRNPVTFLAQLAEVNTLAWSPDSKRIVSSDSGGQVQVWDALTGDHLLTYPHASGAVDTVAWAPDGRYLVSGGDDFKVRVWALDNNKDPLCTYAKHTDIIRLVTWSPDGKFIASASYDGTVQVWDALTCTYERMYHEH